MLRGVLTIFGVTGKSLVQTYKSGLYSVGSVIPATIPFAVWLTINFQGNSQNAQRFGELLLSFISIAAFSAWTALIFAILAVFSLGIPIYILLIYLGLPWTLALLMVSLSPGVFSVIAFDSAVGLPVLYFGACAGLAFWWSERRAGKPHEN
jgi:hypothetical protein